MASGHAPPCQCKPQRYHKCIWTSSYGRGSSLPQTQNRLLIFFTSRQTNYFLLAKTVPSNVETQQHIFLKVCMCVCSCKYVCMHEDKRKRLVKLSSVFPHFDLMLSYKIWGCCKQAACTFPQHPDSWNNQKLY